MLKTFGTIDLIYRIFKEEGTALESSRCTLHLWAAIWSCAVSTMHQAHGIQAKDSQEQKHKHGLEQ